MDIKELPKLLMDAAHATIDDETPSGKDLRTRLCKAAAEFQDEGLVFNIGAKVTISNIDHESVKVFVESDRLDDDMALTFTFTSEGVITDLQDVDLGEITATDSVMYDDIEGRLS